MKHVILLCAAALVASCASTPEGGYGNCGPDCLAAKGLPVPTHREQPQYPREALAASLGGCVVASFLLDERGVANSYQVLDSQPKGVFDQATLRALNDWRFAPAKPGRYAQVLEYKLSSGQKNSPTCIESPSYSQLNGKSS